MYKPNIGAQTDTANFDPQVRSNLSVARLYSMNMVVSLPYLKVEHWHEASSSEPCSWTYCYLTYSPQFTAEAAVDSVVEGSAMGGQANQFEGFTYQEDGVLG